MVLLHKEAHKDLTDPSNFRPISVINAEGKLLERLILQRFERYLESVANGRSPNQYGFKRDRSTIDALERVLEVTQLFNRGPT